MHPPTGQAGPSGDRAGSSEAAALDRALAPGKAFALRVALVGGIGRIPVAPATAAAAVTSLAFWWWGLAATRTGLSTVVQAGIWLAIGVAVSTLGVWAAGHAEIVLDRPDDNRIVIDEVAGQWLAFAPLAVAGPALAADPAAFFYWVVTGFVAFRVFDVAKPGVIRWTERRLGGGLGVMADDWMAGLHAAVVLGVARLAVADIADIADAADIADIADIVGIVADAVADAVADGSAPDVAFAFSALGASGAAPGLAGLGGLVGLAGSVA